MMKKIFLLLLLFLLASCSPDSSAPPSGVGDNDAVPAQSAPPGDTPLGDTLLGDTPLEQDVGADFFKPGTYEPSAIDNRLAEMTAAEKIGQLIIARVPRDYEAYIRDYHIGGFALFGEDVESQAQVMELTAQMQRRASIPLFISVDEEGGRVSRVGKLFNDPVPPMYEIGQTGDVSQAYDAAFRIGSYLSALGIDMDFAPVADVWSNPDNTVIGDRSFGQDAETAAPMVAAAVEGLRGAGVWAVVKHFPGHGDTAQDSHRELATYEHGRDRFDTVEALPFLAGIEAGAAGVMVGHIATPEITGNDLPATFSDYWMQDVLRGEMGYDGLIITDGLEMGALVNSYTPEQIALNAFMAGADVLLIPPDVPAAINALTEAYENGTVTDERLNDSVRRILRLKLEVSPLDMIMARYEGKDKLTDWEAVVLGLNGGNADAYFARREEEAQPEEAYRLVTDYARVATAYRANGKDAPNIDEIIQFENIQNQGVNGYTWALIALYGQDGAVVEPFIENLLQYQTADGGFSFTRDPEENVKGDIDLTAMAVTALAPYADVSAAVQFLKEAWPNAAFSESLAQTIVALRAAGEDVDAALAEKLDSFYLRNGFYTHSLEDPKRDYIATYQAALALTALKNADKAGASQPEGSYCKLSVLTDTEVIIDNTTVSLTSGDSVIDLLETALRSGRLQYDISGGGATAYVKGINNLYEFDQGSESGWLYSVNGEEPQMSAGAYEPQSGDIIVWRYVTENETF